MYCTIQEAWGEPLQEMNVGGKSSSIMSKKSNHGHSKKIAQQQQFMQKALPPPVQSVRGSSNSTNSAVDIKNYSRDVTLLPGHSQKENRIPSEKNITIEPYLIDSESTDMYYQLDSSDSVPEDTSNQFIPVKSEMQILLMKIDEILKRIDNLNQLVEPQRTAHHQDSLTVVCNTLLGIFAGVFIIFLFDMVFRYARI
jgi:hypothetical protein